MRFVVDASLPPEWASLPVELGHAAVPWHGVAPTEARDDETLRGAAGGDRVALTGDLGSGGAVAIRGGAATSVGHARLGTPDPQVDGAFVLRSVASAGEASGGAILTIDAGQTGLRPGFGTRSHDG